MESYLNVGLEGVGMRSEGLLRLLSLLGDWNKPGEPLYASLASAIEATVARKELVPGDRLPSERELAVALGLSRATVLRAFLHLKESGVVVGQQGSGTRVAGAPTTKVSWSRGARTSSRLAPGGVETSSSIVDLSLTAPEAPQALAQILADQGPSLLSERDYHPQGLPQLRKLIAGRYDNAGLPTTPEQIIITTGAQQAIGLVAAAELSRGDRVLIEDPTYYGAVDVYSLAGARLVGIPVGRLGLNPSVTRHMILSTSPRLLHVTPDHQNPTGVVYSPDVRAELAEIADETGLTVLEDDTLRELWFDKEPPLPLAAWSRKDRVVTVGSFSKTLWAGLRVGWLRLPRRDVGRYIAIKAAADLGTGYLGQALVVSANSMINALIRDHATKLRCARDIMAGLLRQNIPDWTFTSPSGGAFLWVGVGGVNTTTFQQLALRQGVVCTDGDLLSPTRSVLHHLRLAFAQPTESLELGVHRLVATWLSSTRHALNDRERKSLRGDLSEFGHR
jgi:DNA-binding transcriptional MocR family regulator